MSVIIPVNRTDSYRGTGKIDRDIDIPELIVVHAHSGLPYIFRKFHADQRYVGTAADSADGKG